MLVMTDEICVYSEPNEAHEQQVRLGCNAMLPRAVQHGTLCQRVPVLAVAAE